jgi:hypothetical protein
LNLASASGQPLEKEQGNQKEAIAKENQTNHKRRAKSSFHTTEEKQISVETKRRNPEAYHHTIKEDQHGVASQSASIRIHFSGIGHSINEQMNREESHSLDFKM